MDAAERPHDPVQLRLAGVVARRGPTTWAGLVESFLALYQSEETRRAYRRAASSWATWCAEAGLDPLQATRFDVIAYVAHLEASGRGNSARGQALAGIAGVYRLGYVDGLVDADPTAHVRRPPRTETTSLGLDAPALADLLAAADDHSPLAAALYRIYAFNGLRASEPIGADVSALSYQRGHLVLKVTKKGGKPLDARLAKVTAAALTTYLDGRTSGPLFLRPARKGRSLDWTTPATPRARLTYSQVDRLTKKLLAAAGLPAGVLHTHDLRHGFVTLAGDAGAQLQHTQDAVGHADPRTTRGYDRRKGAIDHHPTELVAELVTRGRPLTLFDD